MERLYPPPIMSDPKPKSQGLCETTLTERFEVENCECNTYEGNLGPCATFLEGANWNCVYCDHSEKCHAQTVRGDAG